MEIYGENILSPGIFIPLFEEDGLITKLDDIVLKKVCIKLKEWEKQGKPLYPISVNVSRKSIGIPGLVEHLTEIVDSFGVDHSLIDFELTESAMYDNQDTMIKIIEKLKHQGFKLSMDDFGTGYSNFHYLNEPNPEIIKTDRSFTAEAIADEKEYCLLEQFCSMIHNLNLKICIEGVENEEEWAKIRQLDPDYTQEFLWGRPCSYEDFRKQFVDAEQLIID